MPIIKEPLRVTCFRCDEIVIVAFSQRSKNYSQKNSWNYWTENSEISKKKDKKGDYICDDCLIELYYRHKNEIRNYIPNERKRNLLRIYINEGTIGIKKPFLLPE